jgi:hypothetical protein
MTDRMALPDRSESGWDALGEALKKMPPQSIPRRVRELEGQLSTWPDELRVARPGEPGDAGAAWWTLGREVGTRATCARLVRRLRADAADIAQLSPQSGWTREIHPACDWVVMRVESGTDLLQALARLPAQGLDFSVAYPPGQARTALGAMLRKRGTAGLTRLNVSSLYLGSKQGSLATARGQNDRRLEALDLARNDLGSSLAAVVRTVAAPGVLHRLAIGSNQVGAPDVRFLAEDRFLGSLTHFDAGPNPLSGADLLELFLASPPLELRSLGVAGISGLEDATAELLDPSLMPSLQSLRTYDALKGRFLPDLEARGVLSRITHLDLTGAHFEDEDVEALVTIKRPRQLLIELDEHDIPERMLPVVRRWRERDS